MPLTEQNTVLLDHIVEVHHQSRESGASNATSIEQFKRPQHLEAIVDALQPLRGVAKITAQWRACDAH
jgi:hypothetical protein